MKSPLSSRYLRLVLAAAFLASGGGLGVARAQAKDPRKVISGFRAEYLRQLDEIQKKLVDLATAFPKEKYVWRPGEDVRSVSEVLVHVAQSNFFLPTLTG